MKHSQKILIYSLVAFFLTAAGVLSGCNFPRPQSPIDRSVFSLRGIDARFLPLYRTLGGETILGAPISGVLQEGEQWCQYTMNAKMCVISGRTDLEAYSFAPVVVEGALMPPTPFPQVTQESGKVVNGYVIHPDFIPLYEQLYGMIFTGQPLGNAWINYDKGRVEQYFENVIIAADLDDDTPTAYLLPAAHAVCTFCDPANRPFGAFTIETQQASPFSTFLTRVNGTAFGEPLTRPFINEDGLQVQIFENAAIAAKPDDLANAWLLPLSYELNMFESNPTEQRYGTDKDVYFYPVGDKGYHVLVWFDQFIVNHGGRNTAGNPIAEVAYYDGVIRQCFENYCLDLEQDPESGLPVAALAPLGSWYVDQQLKTGHLTEDQLMVAWATPETIQFEIGEQQAKIDRDTSQVIYLSIISSETGQPLSDVRSTVTLLTPDNQQMELELMPTDQNGLTWVEVPAHSQLDNGTVIRYEVCLELNSGQEVCDASAYLVKD